MGGKRQGQREAIEAGTVMGWELQRTTKAGYAIMVCPCGLHRETIHKTPSDPNHFRNAVSHMRRACNTR